MRIRNVEGKQFQQRNQSMLNSGVKTNISFGNKAKFIPSILGGVVMSVASIIPSHAQTASQLQMLNQFAEEQTDDLDHFLGGDFYTTYDRNLNKTQAGSKYIRYHGGDYCDMDSVLSKQPEFNQYVRKVDKELTRLYDTYPNSYVLNFYKRPFSGNPKKNIVTVQQLIDSVKKEKGATAFPLVALDFVKPYDYAAPKGYAESIKKAFFNVSKKYADYNSGDALFIWRLKRNLEDIRKEVFRKNVSKYILIDFFRQR